MAIETAAISSRGSTSEPVVTPEEILDEVLRLDEGLTLTPYYSERSVFFNPGRSAALGTIVASIKTHDGPKDTRSALSRPGVFRFAFQLSRVEYIARLGDVPRRPLKGKVVSIQHDPAVLNQLTPHPVYAWMRWVQILSPTRPAFDDVMPLVRESLESVKARWKARSSER